MHFPLHKDDNLLTLKSDIYKEIPEVVPKVITFFNLRKIYIRKTLNRIKSSGKQITFHEIK